MVRSLLVLPALLAIAVALPASASAAPAAGVSVASTTRDQDGLTVALRCTVAGDGPCQVRVVVRARGAAGGVLAARTLLVRAGELRRVRLGLTDPSPLARAATTNAVRLTVTARQGARRLGTPYRRTVRPAPVRAGGWVTDFDGAADSRVVKLQFGVSDGCPERIVLRSLVQRADGVEVELADGGDASAPGTLCAQAVRKGCVFVTLDEPLGQRAVWSRSGAVLESPAPRLPGPPVSGYGRPAWDSCAEVTLGAPAVA